MTAEPLAACPRCRAPTAGEYCLECGVRLPRRRPLSELLGDGLGEHPLWPALALLVLAAAGALAAIAASRDGGEKALVVATALPARTVVRKPPIVGVPTAPEATIPLVTTVAPPGTTPPTATTLTQWTAADGYTVVLASLPKSTGKPTAEQLAKHALATGLVQVGVLDSKGFANLQPGLLIVFAGLYDSQAAAAAHVAEAKSAGFQLAYARRITR